MRRMVRSLLIGARSPIRPILCCSSVDDNFRCDRFNRMRRAICSCAVHQSRYLFTGCAYGCLPQLDPAKPFVRGSKREACSL